MDYRLGAFEPDRPITGEPDEFGAIHLREAERVIPTAYGYRPTRLPVVRSAQGALDGPCRGFKGLRVSDGTTYLAAGSQSKLWLTGAGALVDSTGASVPSLGDQGRWEFDAYDQYVLAASQSIPIQRSTGGGAFADISADAPRANHIFVLDEFLVACDIVGRGANSGMGTRRDGVHWCGRGDISSWLGIGTDAALAVESDAYFLRGESGPITQGIAMAEFALIARERALWRMDYTGGADVMAFTRLEGERGCIAPGAGIAVGSRAYFPSEEGFLVCDGETCKAIGWEKIDRTWFNALGTFDLDLMSSHHDWESRTIWWFHPGSQRAWIYNYLADRWSTVPMIAEWIGGVLPIAESMDSGSMSAADMDTTFGATDMDSLISGANESLAIFDGNHQLATLDGDPVDNAHLRTARFVLSEEGKRSLLRSTRPYTDNEGGTIAIAARGYLTPDAADAALSYRQPTASGLAAHRASGRFHEFDFLFGGEQDVVGFDAVISPQGVR